MELIPTKDDMLKAFAEENKIPIIVHEVATCDQLKEFFQGTSAPPDCSVCDVQDCGYKGLPQS